MKIPELLAPVNSFDFLKIAINAGASAVYLSGKNYGARAFAQNFEIAELKEAIKISHLYNVKIYITVNILIKESELSDVLDYLEKLYKWGIDGVIVQDLGLIFLIREFIPNLNVFVSTQFNALNQYRINFLEDLGVKRVILPRELRKSEISNLNTNLDLEIFAHGALCYSYSGQCLFSFFKGGRSGNRGTCAQPCRKNYIIHNVEDNFLSPKDLCLFDYLNEIAELNISSIKIEGRLRNKEYLAIVINSYRQALNKLKSGKNINNEDLSLVFNRGFTSGQFKQKADKSLKPGHIGLEIGSVLNVFKNQIAILLNDSLKTIPEKGDGILFLKNKDSFGFEISKDSYLTTLNHFNKGKLKKIKDINRSDRVLIINKVRENGKESFDLKNSSVYLTKRNKIIKKAKDIEKKGSSFFKSSLNLTFSIKNNRPILKGSLFPQNIKVEVVGNVEFEKPIKKVLSSETIEKQLSKLGDYPFKLNHININYKDNLFLPISEVNKLRRDLLAKLEFELIKSFEHPDFKLNYYKKSFDNKHSSKINYSFYINDLNSLKLLNCAKRVYIEIPPSGNSFNMNNCISFLKDAILIANDKDFELIWKWPDIAHDNLIRDLNKIKGILNKYGFEIPIMSSHYNSSFMPYTGNIFNSVSVNHLDNYELVSLSPELSIRDIKDIVNYVDVSKIEVLLFANMELMKSRYKIFPQTNELKDNEGNSYLVKDNISNEELIILNNEDFSLFNDFNNLKSFGIFNFALDLRWKDIDSIKKILSKCSI